MKVYLFWSQSSDGFIGKTVMAQPLMDHVLWARIKPLREAALSFPTPERQGLSRSWSVGCHIQCIHQCADNGTGFFFRLVGWRQNRKNHVAVL